MKTTTTISAILLVLFFTAGAVSAQSLKIGTVYMRDIFDAYYGTEEFTTAVNNARREAAKEQENRMDAAKRLLDEVKKLDKDLALPGLSPEFRAEKQKLRKQRADALQSIPPEIPEIHPTLEKQVVERTERLSVAFAEEVKKIVADMAKAEGYDKSGVTSNGTPVAIHIRESTDLTTAVIKTLRDHGRIGKMGRWFRLFPDEAPILPRTEK